MSATTVSAVQKGDHVQLIIDGYVKPVDGVVEKLTDGAIFFTNGKGFRREYVSHVNLLGRG